jgi:hypothetical protein
MGEKSVTEVRCMKFDEKAPGGGVWASCVVENGKVSLEWKMHFVQWPPRKFDSIQEQAAVRVRLIDRKGNLVWEGLQALQEEEPLKAILLQPNLWQAVKNPYFYDLEAVLEDRDGRPQDRLLGSLALRNLKTAIGSGRRELLLNGEPFELKAVRYHLPFDRSGTEWQRIVLEDLRLLMCVGANCICLETEGEPGRPLMQFRQLCDRYGILVLVRKREKGDLWVCDWEPDVSVMREEAIPVFRGMEKSFFGCDDLYPTSLYYQYKARWSKEPFVYLVPESVRKMRSGNYAVTCYSNCERVALYSDGILFEFQQGEGEIIFCEIPARSPSVILTAEGDGCSASLSVHKVLVKACESRPSAPSVESA